MIVIGVCADQGLAWPDQLKSTSGIRVIRLSALQEAAAVDICVYVFARVRQGLSQAVTEISAANARSLSSSIKSMISISLCYW